MTTEVIELVETEKISESEIIELIETYQKLTKFGILSNDGFEYILDQLGVIQTSENVFSFGDEIEYKLP